MFAHWLSHVPDERFAAFWRFVGDALAPGGRAFLIDSRRTTRSTASDHVQPGSGEDTMVRRLDDGRAFRIVKRFWEPDALAAELAGARLADGPRGHRRVLRLRLRRARRTVRRATRRTPAREA